MDLTFEEPVVGGVVGRNGAVNFGGLSVLPLGAQVSLTPLGPSGSAINAAMNFLAGDCGKVARAIAEAAAEADPECREEIAAQLRAALVAVECGVAEQVDDGLSNFFSR